MRIDIYFYNLEFNFLAKILLNCFDCLIWLENRQGGLTKFYNHLL